MFHPPASAPVWKSSSVARQGSRSFLLTSACHSAWWFRELWVMMGFRCVWIHMLLFPPGSWRDSLGIPKTVWASLTSPHPFFKYCHESCHCNSKGTGYWGKSLPGLFWTCRCTVNTHQELRPTRGPHLLHWPIFSKKTSRRTMHSFQALSYIIHLALSPFPARLIYNIFLD